MKRTLEEEKKWYMDAVKSDLILNKGLSAKDAAVAIQKYGLKKRIDRFPYQQMHDDIESVTNDMKKQDILS